MDDKHLDKRQERFCDEADTRSRQAAGLDRREFMAAAGATAVVATAGLAASEAEAAFSDRVAGITQDEPMQLIGTGVSAQERFFKKFEEMSGGLQVTGQVASLADSVQKWMTGGHQTFSMIETNAFRVPALREAETIAPIPTDKITNWEFADSLFTDPAHVGADHTSGWPVAMVYWDDSRTSFGMLPQIYNMDALGILPHKFADTQSDRNTPDTLGVLYEGQWRDVDVRGKVSIQNEDLIGPPRCASYLVKNRKMDPVKVGYGDLEPDELKNVIDFLIGAKQDGRLPRALDQLRRGREPARLRGGMGHRLLESGDRRCEEARHPLLVCGRLGGYRRLVLRHVPLQRGAAARGRHGLHGLVSRRLARCGRRRAGLLLALPRHGAELHDRGNRG